VVRVLPETPGTKHARHEDNDAVEIPIFATTRLLSTVGFATWSVTDWSINCHPVRARCDGKSCSRFQDKLFEAHYDELLPE
jgi:hypothetical protein